MSSQLRLSRWRVSNRGIARDRQQAIQKITENGGEHFGDLNKSVTHLIAMKPTGQKYKYAQVWGLKVVSMEWLDDSIERGMTLEESLYSPHLAEEERGKGSWVRRTASGTSLGKRAREDSETVDAALGRRKLRRTASAKLTSQNNDIWKDIVGGGGFATTAPQVGQWEEEKPLVVKSFDALDRPVSVTTLSEMSNKENERPSRVPSAPVHQAQVNKKHGLFRGKKVYLYGFDERKTSILRDHLLSNDAEIASSIVELSQSTPDTLASEGYIIVPHTSDRKQQPEPPPSQIPLHTVSEWWLERCLHRKIVVDPEVDTASFPFQKYPISGFDGMTICSTGFSGVDLLHVSKTARLLGAAYEEYFSSSATILLCNGPSANIEKRRHAADWRVPAVGIDWLWDCVRTGHKKAYSSYLVPAPAREPSPTDQSQTLETSTQFDRRMAQLSDGMTNNVSRQRNTSGATLISKTKSASTSKRNAAERDVTTNEKPVAKGSDRSKSPSSPKATESIPARAAPAAASAMPSPPPEATKQYNLPPKPAPSTTSLLDELAALRSHRTTSTTTSTSMTHPQNRLPHPSAAAVSSAAPPATPAHTPRLSRAAARPTPKPTPSPAAGPPRRPKPPPDPWPAKSHMTTRMRGGIGSVWAV